MRKPAKFIINSYNTMSAGTMNVTKSLLSGFPKKEDMLVVFVLPYVKEFLSMRSLNDRDDMKLVYVYRFGTIINKIFKVFFDFFIFPVICLVINPKSVFVLGNYAPFPSKGKKIVLVRHPFLIEKDLVRKQGFLSRVVELVRKAEFVLTLKFTDVLIVQSGYVQKKIVELYGFPSHKIVVLPNPKSSMIDYSVSKERSVDPLFLYISRYYPHKNHKFIIDLVEAYSHYFRARKIKFVVTIDPKLGSHAAGLLERIQRSDIGDIIENIGEVSQEQLSGYYKKAWGVFFPSSSETFGNPLIEAMGFGLPIVVPDLGYARAVCEEAALYYKEEDRDDAFSKLSGLIEDEKAMRDYSLRSKSQFDKYPSTNQWVDFVFKLME